MVQGGRGEVRPAGETSVRLGRVLSAILMRLKFILRKMGSHGRI